MTDDKRDEAWLKDELLRCETAVWEALVTGDMAADAAALDARFLGVYPDGFAGKDDHVAQLLRGPTMDAYELDQARVMWLGMAHALLSYRATYRRRHRAADEVMFISSIWEKCPEGWISVFSQDTPASDQ